MVSSAALISMWIGAILCFLFPIITFLILKKREDIEIKPVLVGMAIFFIFTQILEKALHMVVIGNNLIHNYLILSIYGALAAGIFEETGRFVAFKTILKKNHQWKDGIAYGIGHGGMEAWLIGVLGYVQSIVYSNLINSGKFDTILGSKLSASQLEQLKQLKNGLINTTVSDSVIGVLERIFAFGIQMALTMVVLYAIRYRKNIYFFAGILLHALVDFPAALYQMKIITNLYVVEGMVFIMFVIALVFLSRTKKIFANSALNDK